jgi:uncharacterized protein
MVLMQTLERRGGVTTYGVASMQAKPDLVRVRFRVLRLEESPAQSFAAASEAVGDVRRVLREHRIPDAAVQHSQLALSSEWDYGAGRKLLGYRCAATFLVESGDLDDLQPLLVDLVTAGVNELDGVDFDVADKAGLRAEARREAVAAARRKAELYAAAAGVRLGAVVRIDDVDPGQGGIQVFRAESTGAQSTQEDLAPGHIVVTASVILGFAIAPD